MSLTIVISHSPVQVGVGFTTIFNQFVVLFVNPFRLKNVRSIVYEYCFYSTVCEATVASMHFMDSTTIFRLSGPWIAPAFLMVPNQEQEKGEMYEADTVYSCDHYAVPWAD